MHCLCIDLYQKSLKSQASRYSASRSVRICLHCFTDGWNAFLLQSCQHKTGESKHNSSAFPVGTLCPCWDPVFAQLGLAQAGITLCRGHYGPQRPAEERCFDLNCLTLDCTKLKGASHDPLCWSSRRSRHLLQSSRNNPPAVASSAVRVQASTLTGKLVLSPHRNET